MKRNIKLEIAYDGSAYNGWQRQDNTEKTIQGILESTISSLLSEEVRLHASGRTDAGVHARAQVANLHIKSEFLPQSLLQQMNGRLPGDIRILHMEEVPKEFHARYSAVAKRYSYSLWTADVPIVFGRKYIYEIGKILDLQAMQEAGRHLLGEHDFQSFCSEKSQEKSSVRRIDDIHMEQNGCRITIFYQGNGFLYNMVRILTGTLIEIGLGKRAAASIPDILQAGKREAAGFTAPPQGLCLEKVFYS